MLITVKSTSRVNVIQLLECWIIIQMMPFNDFMNVDFDQKSVSKLSLIRKKMLNLFLEDLFCIFIFCYKLSIECQISIILHCF